MTTPPTCSLRFCYKQTKKRMPTFPTLDLFHTIIMFIIDLRSRKASKVVKMETIEWQYIEKWSLCSLDTNTNISRLDWLEWRNKIHVLYPKILGQGFVMTMMMMVSILFHVHGGIFFFFCLIRLHYPATLFMELHKSFIDRRSAKDINLDTSVLKLMIVQVP